MHSKGADGPRQHSQGSTIDHPVGNPELMVQKFVVEATHHRPRCVGFLLADPVTGCHWCISVCPPARSKNSVAFLLQLRGFVSPSQLRDVESIEASHEFWPKSIRHSTRMENNNDLDRSTDQQNLVTTNLARDCLAKGTHY